MNRSYRYRIHQVKLGLGENKDALAGKILRKLGNKDYQISDMEIIRGSIDARNKSDIKLVYTVDFSVVSRKRPDVQIALPLNRKLNIEEAPDMAYREVAAGEQAMKNRPVIVGFGPCGMFCGLILARRGYRPIILERGNDVDQRVLDVEHFWKDGVLNTESNVQFGEGGAGTFSDGKLTTGIKDPRIRKVLTEFVRAGAPEDILYKQKPHIGTDVLRSVVKNIRQEIIRCGGEVRFATRLERVHIKDGRVASVTVVSGQGNPERFPGKNSAESPSEVTTEIPAENLVIAIGHSARDTFRHLFEQGVEMTQKPFSIGVRIEHPQDCIDRAQYGENKGLPPADYKLSTRCANGRGVYTFCMCPGGEVVVASSQEGGVVTNGMSNRARNSGRANSGLLVDVRCEDFGSDHPLAGVAFQEKYEHLAFLNGGSNYQAPKTTWGEFRDNTESAQPVIGSLPAFATEAIREAMPVFGRRLEGFDGDSAVMIATETRSSSPVRFARKENLEGTFGGLYPAGEGTGHAGGIVSAACDGIRVAEKIIEKYRPAEDRPIE